MIDRRALIAGGAAAVVAGGAWTLLRPTQQSEGLLPGAAFAQEAEAGTETGNPTSEIVEMVLGNPEAAVEVIEYASFTCPHCANFHANQFKELKANYIDTGLIRFVYREVYFDRPGLWASMIARCGGESRFFGITNLLYEQQRDWLSSQDPNVIVENLMRIGKTAGMSDEELDACMRNGELAQNLVTWYEANRDADGINSTPSFVIDGEKFSNMAYPEFASLLDAKLAATDG